MPFSFPGKEGSRTPLSRLMSPERWQHFTWKVILQGKECLSQIFKRSHKKYQDPVFLGVGWNCLHPLAVPILKQHTIFSGFSNKPLPDLSHWLQKLLLCILFQQRDLCDEINEQNAPQIRHSDFKIFPSQHPSPPSSLAGRATHFGTLKFFDSPNEHCRI